MNGQLQLSKIDKCYPKDRDTESMCKYLMQKCASLFCLQVSVKPKLDKPWYLSGVAFMLFNIIRMFLITPQLFCM